MMLAREIRKRARQIALPVLGICLLGYFFYHFLHGERGLFAWLAINRQIEDARKEVAATAAERAELERRVSLLGSRSLDLDMLDERVRTMLNYGHPDELVILHADAPESSAAPASGN
jgi:cell division protein FtsB